MPREADPVKQAERTAERAANFKKLANKRVNNVLGEFAALANLASPNYVSTAEQRDKIIKVIRTEFGKLEAVYAGEKKASVGFDIDADNTAAPASEEGAQS